MVEIILPTNLLSVIRGKYLLLDTSVFIDAFNHPSEFTEFLNDLRIQEVTLLTIDLVKIEFLKGAPDDDRYKEKEALIDKIVDEILIPTPDITTNVYSLLKKYRLDGKAASITDLHLGAYLKKFASSLYLLTRNPSDFPLNVFKLMSVVNVSYMKGIHAYGVFQYKL